MTEALAVEAVKASGAANAVATPTASPAQVDPAAVAAFDQAMAAEAPTPIPFIEQLGAAWKSAQLNNQEHIQRMSRLGELSQREALSVAELTALQYELQTMNFQTEVTTIVAKKASDMVQTLVKNG